MAEEGAALRAVPSGAAAKQIEVPIRKAVGPGDDKITPGRISSAPSSSARSW